MQIKSWVLAGTLAIGVIVIAQTAVDSATRSAGAGPAAYTETIPNTKVTFDMPEGWAVKDGALIRVSKTTDIVTDEEFANFELQFEWKIAKNGNSGLFFHVVEAPKFKETYYTGPEFQLLDNAGHPDGKNGPDRWAGANYALHAPTQNTAHGPGEWNECRLIVNNGHAGTVPGDCLLTLRRSRRSVST